MMVSDLTEEVVLFKREHTITTQARPQQKKKKKTLQGQAFKSAWER